MESLIELFSVLLFILVTVLLWKDYLLTNTLAGIFLYSVKVWVMILLQCKNDCM